MLDEELATRIERIGHEVCIRLGLEPAKYKKYLGLFEKMIIKNEIKKVLAMMDNPETEFEPLDNPMLTDEGDDEEWKSEPCM
jgi:hypothetical protein